MIPGENRKLTFPETDGPIPTFAPVPDQSSLPAGDFDLSPFGMELGQFMMDDDLVAMIDKQALLSNDPGCTYPA